MANTNNNHKENTELKEYADGWITERKGTDAPPFLKAAYIVISLGCLAYLVIYMNGDVNHAERGYLVRAFNAATQTADGFMYFVAALVAIYIVVLLAFVFKNMKEH